MASIGEALKEWAEVEMCRAMVAEILMEAERLAGMTLNHKLEDKLDQLCRELHRKHSDIAGRELLRPVFRFSPNGDCTLELEGHPALNYT